MGERRREEAYDVCVYVWWVWGREEGRRCTMCECVCGGCGGEKKGGDVRCVSVCVVGVGERRREETYDVCVCMCGGCGGEKIRRGRKMNREMGR